MRLIIDTDPGVDDVIAIALAVALEEVELIGLTTVFGNTFVGQSSRNARFVMDFLRQDAPVYEGAALPYGAVDYTPSANVHGPEGLGGRTHVPDVGQNGALSAAEYLVEAAREHKGELVVCAVAPLTNIADAVRLDPEFVGNVKQLVVMGGALDDAGNITPFAEANIYHDAQAADVVFAAGFDLMMIGLDVTRQTLLTMAQIEALAKRAPRIGGLLAEIAPFYLDFYKQVEGLEGCPVHDAAAVLACVAPERFGFETVGVEVVQDGEALGQTVRTDGRAECRVALSVEAAWAERRLLDALAELG